MKVFCKHFCFFLFMILGCKSPFSTREAEPPKTPQSSWTPAHSPYQVLSNMQKAILERNVENYLRCLVDTSYSDKTFSFDPDPEVAANYPGIFVAWNKEKEMTVIQQVFSLVPTDSTSFLKFKEEIREIVASDSAVFARGYRLELHHMQSTLPMVYEGQVELWLVPDQRGEWATYRWIDNSVTGFPSWSLLKASLGG